MYSNDGGSSSQYNNNCVPTDDDYVKRKRPLCAGEINR